MREVFRDCSRSVRFVFAVALAAAVAPAGVLADDWPQWGGPRRDLIWRETGVVTEQLPDPGRDGLLPRVWSAPLGEGYAGPSVANGRVFVMDRQQERGTERVLCLDADTGKEHWNHEYEVRYEVSYPAGPRSTPTVDGGRVYTIGAMGHMAITRS